MHLTRWNSLPETLQTSKTQGRGTFSAPAFRTAAILLVSILFLPLTSQAQQGKVLVESSEQLFSVLAAINDAGYDSGAGAGEVNKARNAVRADLAAKNIPVLSELRNFYESHRLGDPGRNLGQYISLALLLGPPPDFKLSVAQADLPPDARNVAGLVPLLQQFYKQADLIDLWARASIDFHSDIESYSVPVRKSIELTDAYLRFPAGSYLGRTYTIYLDLLGAPNQVQASMAPTIIW